MKLVCTFLVVICAVCFPVEAIYNGTFISIKQAPYFVSLVDPTYNVSYCGGTIISAHWIVTAGHCIDYQYGKSPKYIKSGATSNREGGQLTEVEKAIVYGGYDIINSLQTNDIALVKLKEPLSFNEYQQPITLSSDITKAGDKLKLIGSGRQGSGNPFQKKALKQTEVLVNDDGACEWALGTSLKSIFCAGNGKVTSSCLGDSGAPALLNEKLIGITSMGWGCGRRFSPADIPVAYTRIHVFHNWILKHTGIKYLE